MFLIFLFSFFFFFFFNDTATTEIYTLSLHDALPICFADAENKRRAVETLVGEFSFKSWSSGDRKSTRLNSSHQIISYAVFCLKKKKKNNKREIKKQKNQYKTEKNKRNEHRDVLSRNK